MLELTNLTRETIDEICELWERENDTSARTRRDVLGDGGIGSSITDFLKVERAAINLADRMFDEYLNTLPKDQVLDLIALMWMGRQAATVGDIPTKEVFLYYRTLAEQQEEGDSDLGYLREKPLPLYLKSVLKRGSNC